MSDPFAKQPVSPRAIMAASAVVIFALIAASVGRITDVGTTALPDGAAVVQSRDLNFRDQDDGSVAVIAANGGGVIHIVEPGTGGFIRGVLRGLGRDRKLRGIGPEPTFRLTRWEDGRLSLSDTATGVRIDLEPFGQTNFESFAMLLGAEGVALQPNSQVSL